MKISKLVDISKNFEKKVIAMSKKGCKFAPSNNKEIINLKSTAMKNQSYNGQMPKEFTERIGMLVNAAVNDVTVRSITDNMTDAAKVDIIARLILASI